MRHPLGLLLCLACPWLVAQDCSIPFTEPLFDVQSEADIWYGNAPRFDGGTDSLRLNLYKPLGDGQTERPLLILIHGGGFIGGHRNDLNAVCSSIASMGWATATVSYRLGIYGTGILDPPFAYDPYEATRAAYRAMQDVKGAIRFLKERHLQDSTSTANVLLMGFSAGAITALHAAYLDQPAEKPAVCNAIGDVQHFFNFYPRPDLGPVDGTLNQNGMDASVLGLANMFGALIDTNYIESNADPALYSYHQDQDPVVGCYHQQIYWGLPLGVSATYPWWYGSCVIDQRMQHLGFTSDRYLYHPYSGNAHELHDPVGITTESLQWMRELFCSANTGIATNQVSSTPLTFPNPTIGTLTLNAPAPAKSRVQLIDSRGRILMDLALRIDQRVIDLGTPKSGLYFLRLITPEGSMVERVVLE